MADRPRFGPAGFPVAFKQKRASLEEIPRFLRQEGLDALEYEAVYWGSKPQIKKEDAEKLGDSARQNDVWLSMHGSYFINLSAGEKTIAEASKKRLLACATAAHWMGAHVVVFHPGSYARRPKERALYTFTQNLRSVVETLRALGITDVKLGPETMGKVAQLGTLDEMLDVLKEVEQTQLVIDWSHLHARSMGGLRSEADFTRVVERAEKRLGTEATKDMHCHFTKIEYTEKGERSHHALEEERYGPDFAKLARVIVDHKLRPVVICESPLIDQDAKRMRDVLNGIGQGR